MKDFTIKQIKTLCLGNKLPLDIPFIDERMEEYREKYNGNHQYYAVLHAITKALEPAVVLEIGTWEGTSAACFAAGFPDAEVFTIDHHSDPGDEKNYQRTQEAMVKYPNIRYFQGCSTERVHAEKPGTRWVYPNIVEALAGRKIDILFIDGWHRGDMARADWDTYSPLLGNHSLVICDDICGGDDPTISGMLKFWEALPGEKHLDGWIHPGYPMGFLKYVEPA